MVATLNQLPDSIVRHIGCYFSIEDVDCLRRINSHWFHSIGSSEYLKERQVQGVAEEVLCWTNGKYIASKSKGTNKSKNNRNQKLLEELPLGQIHCYIPSLHQWRVFGATTTNHTDMIPMNCTNKISDYCTVWIPSLYTAVFLGGYNMENGAINVTVWAYSFLTNTLQPWPSLLHSSLPEQTQGQKEKNHTKYPSPSYTDRLHATLIGNFTIIVISTDNTVCNQTLDCSTYATKNSWTRISPLPQQNLCSVTCGSGDIISAIVSSTCSRYLYVLQDNNPQYPALLYHLHTDLWTPLLSCTTYNNKIKPNHQNDLTVPIQSSILHLQNQILFLGGFIYDNNNDSDADTIILDKILYLQEDGETVDMTHFVLGEVKECSLPYAIRGSSCCIYDGKLTMLGGLTGWSVNSLPSNDPWQLIDEYSLNGTSSNGGSLNKQIVSGTWSCLPIRLPFDVILEGLTFSMMM
jgi:hypothetical protein